MKRHTLLFIVFLSSFSFYSYGQKSFDQNIILRITHKETDAQSFMYTGLDVRCKMKNGRRVKGTLVVFTDHIMVDDFEIKTNEIAELSRNNERILSRNLNLIGNRALINSQTRPEVFTGAQIIRTGVSTVLSLAVGRKKYSISKGWGFDIYDKVFLFADNRLLY